MADPTAFPNLSVVAHPLVQHKLTLMRRQECSTSSFRTLLREISMLLAYEVTRDMPTTLRDIETPLAPMQSPVLDGKKIVITTVQKFTFKASNPEEFFVAAT